MNKPMTFASYRPGENEPSVILTEAQVAKTFLTNEDYDEIDERLDELEENGGGGPGTPGEPGMTPHIGENGNWFIGETDTGKPSRGEKGDKGDKGETGATGAQGIPGPAGSDANVTKTNVINALGYTPANKAYEYPTPQEYGAKGDGTTDDTAAFQNALANNRVVFVPGGAYKISSELVIGYNCQLELSQDAVLYFTQTSGNCITMQSSASLKGNHATLSVPYTFAGHVINIDTGTVDAQSGWEPFKKWDPMWKQNRFITNLNIVKPDTRGFYYSMDGSCNGIAVYVCADGSDLCTYIWATELTGLRIAGAFSYGIYAETLSSEGDSGWNHEMKVAGFIDGCEVGVYLKKCKNTYLSTVVQPRRAYTTDGVYLPYAKMGICLDNAPYVDMTGSRVWDWDEEKTLFSPSNSNRHLVFLGNCRGAIIDDWYYYARPTYDIRELIYTDTPANYDEMVIIQEPFTRWFKPLDHVPYFYDGFTNKKLALQEELDEIVKAERTPNFTNVLPTAINTDGSIFNGIGYVKVGYALNSDGSTTESKYLGCTGFIPVKQNDVLYVKGIKIPDTLAADGGTYGHPVVVSYDSAFAYMSHRPGNSIAAENYFFKYESLEDGFKLTVKARPTVAYVRFSYPRENIGEQPVISINKPIEYTPNGVLADGIKVKAGNVIGLPGGGGGGGVTDDEALEQLIEFDLLTAVTNSAGAILTDSDSNIILRY